MKPQVPSHMDFSHLKSRRCFILWSQFSGLLRHIHIIKRTHFAKLGNITQWPFSYETVGALVGITPDAL